MSKMIINDVEYISVGSMGPTPIQIVVIEGRWNIVGNVTTNEDGSMTITNASVIRYWGTTKGLGELAANGPTSKTILDPIGTVHVPSHSIILTVNVTFKEWY